jgi:hypothetical protein
MLVTHCAPEIKEKKAKKAFWAERLQPSGAMTTKTGDLIRCKEVSDEQREAFSGQPSHVKK